jgi:hypothetical protein
MNNLFDNSFSMTLLESEPFADAQIIFSSDDVELAVAISSKINNQSKQWQVYLNALALSAFEDWLESRDSSLTTNSQKCTIVQPAMANLIEGIANLEVGEFKVCLIAMGCIADEYIALPRIVVDLPEFIPHFYVLVEVLAEQQAATVYGYLSHQQLVENLDVTSLEADWDYQFPLSYFDNNIDNLLLSLRCLEKEAIALPDIPSNRLETLGKMEKQLALLLPKLQNPEKELCEVLTWEQATAVLTSSQLVEWIYEVQQQFISTKDTQETFKIKQTQETQYFASLHKQVANLIQFVAQPAINAGRWLWDELDEVAQQLDWELLPDFSNRMQLRPIRSAAEEFEEVVTQLQEQGLEIPVQARAAFKNLSLAGVPLRIYAVTWHLITELQNPEWTLLLILGAPALNGLPQNIKLRVSDRKEILSEQKLNAQADNSYIFTRVLGNWDEKFLVSVSLVDGVEVTLPPFAFNLGN